MFGAQLLSLASQLLGLTITASRSGISGLNSITLEGVSVTHDEMILLAAERIAVRLSLTALFKGELHFSEIVVTGAAFSLERTVEGKWNFPGAQSKSTPETGAINENKTSTSSRLQIESLQILDSSALILDSSRSARAELKKLNLFVRGLQANATATFEHHSEFTCQDRISPQDSIRTLSASNQLSGSFLCGSNLSPKNLQASSSVVDLKYKDLKRNFSEPQFNCSIDATRSHDRWSLNEASLENKARSVRVEARLTELGAQRQVVALSARFDKFDTSAIALPDLPFARGLLSGEFNWKTTFDRLSPS